MAKALSAAELIKRSVDYLTEAGKLLDNEPTDAHAHGCWIIRIRSLIGLGDKAQHTAFRRGADSIECGRLDVLSEHLWQRMLNARRG